MAMQAHAGPRRCALVLDRSGDAHRRPHRPDRLGRTIAGKVVVVNKGRGAMTDIIAVAVVVVVVVAVVGTGQPCLDLTLRVPRRWPPSNS